MSEPLLEIDGLQVSYTAGERVLYGVELAVRSGEIVAVIGANGAGKTTLLRAIAGFLPSERVKVSGSVRLRGRELLGTDPARAARSGLCLIPERHKVFRSLTVAENLALAQQVSPAKALPSAEVLEMFPGLLDRGDQLAGLLSGGEQQMLALAGAFARRPKLLLVDEPSLGLAPIIVNQVLRTIKQLCEELSTTVVLVDQNSLATTAIANRTYLMDSGSLRKAESTAPGGVDYLSAHGRRP